MVTIKQGYNSKETRIKIQRADGESNLADMEIEQFGLPRILGKGGVTRIGENLKDLKVGEAWVPSTTTAHCVSITELLALRDEINQVLKEIIGL